jgi:flagellar basal body-associated protein FliL
MAEVDNKILKASARSSGWILWIPLLLLPLCGAGLWFGLAHQSQPLAADGQQEQVKSTLHLDTFVLNLSDPEQRSYLRVGIDLGLSVEPKRGEYPAPVAEVRDTILGVLAEGKVNELLTESGKTKLKENLLAALRSRMPQLGVEEVYFTEFLIQR